MKSKSNPDPYSDRVKISLPASDSDVDLNDEPIEND